MRTKSLSYLLLCFAFLFPLMASANQTATNVKITTVDDLVSQGKLTITLQLNHKEQQIVGQALVLSIEVATDRWFAKGSHIKNFSLANIVILANNITTINGSKHINGQTWATQTHELTLYPTKPGTYQVPPVQLYVSVNTENNGIINGELTTKASQFKIVLPEALKDIENFIVSSQVIFHIDGQFDQDKLYAIGDAVTQTISIIASDTPAMMIPQLTSTAHPTPTKLSNKERSTSNGISIYRKPAQVLDKSNRGSLTGTRIESFTYIFEKAGRYELAERIIYWWNSQSNELEQLVIPASSWTVSGGGSTQANQSNMIFKNIKLNFTTVLTLICILLLLILAYFILIKRHNFIALYYKLTHYEQRKLRQLFLACIKQKQYLKATQYLYQYTVISKSTQCLKNNKLAIKLNQLAYEDRISEQVQLIFTVNDANVLIKQINIASNLKKNHANFSHNKSIELNKSS